MADETLQPLTTKSATPQRSLVFRYRTHCWRHKPNKSNNKVTMSSCGFHHESLESDIFRTCSKHSGIRVFLLFVFVIARLLPVLIYIREALGSNLSSARFTGEQHHVLISTSVQQDVSTHPPNWPVLRILSQLALWNNDTCLRLLHSFHLGVRMTQI